jgi:hypothetical protein
MSALAKIFEKYSPKAVGFLERIAKKYFDDLGITDPTPEEVESKMVSYDSWVGHRIENIDRDFPEAFDQYETDTLQKAIESTEISEKSSLAVMDPKNFEKIAQPIPYEFMDYGHGIPMPENPEVRTSREKIAYLTDAFSQGQPIKKMPEYWFQTVKQPEQLDYLNRPFEYFQAAGHEGRHRNRALVAAGKDKSLVKVYHPTGESPKDSPDAMIRSERPYDPEGTPGQILPGTVADYLKFVGFGGLATLPMTQQDQQMSP